MRGGLALEAARAPHFRRDHGGFRIPRVDNPEALFGVRVRVERIRSALQLAPCEQDRPVLTDWELWACAAEVQNQHGERAPVFVAERIGALLMAGDPEGVATWKAIAARLQQLRAVPATPS